MASFNIYKETALPQTLTANSIYLIAPENDNDHVEVYVTGKTPSIVRRTINKTDIQLMIDSAGLGGGTSSNSLVIVQTIAERDLLELTSNTFVLVNNATGDSTVSAGAALYVWNQNLSTYNKISEYESMDVSLKWADIQNKPNSTPTAIDAAVTDSHKHTNKTQLDKIGEDGDGNMTYAGKGISATWTSTQW